MCLLFIVMMSLLIYGCNDNINRIGDFKVKRSRKVPNGYEIIKYFGSGQNISIPQKYKNKNIVGIGERVFENRLNIERIDIPSNIKYIEYDAFKKCNNLEKVTFNEGLKEIGWGAFNGTKISRIDMPTTLDSIGIEAFGDCEKLKTVILNERLKKIGSGAFKHTPIEEIIIPKFVYEMGKEVFFECGSLKKIYCKVKSRPAGWDDGWNLYKDNGWRGGLIDREFHDVLWGYVG